MKERIKAYVDANREELFSVLRELCLIPAPSHLEDARAAYCKNYLEKAGAKGVYIDEAKNVIFPLGCEGSDSITVMAAHTDTVFPDTEPMPYVDDGERIHCPGVGDDTANVVVLMLVAKFMLKEGITPEGGILFVCNSCEEGLGNLKGCRQIFKDYAGRIRQFISFDGYFSELSDRCVGSHRYEVEVTTQGGHSWSRFGRKNAIAELSAIIGKIYAIDVPHVGDSRTTYNVGTVEGGTSINTIAQSAKMFCEYRSDNEECLAIMEAHFKSIFSEANTEEVQVSVERVGERPCMGKVDLAKISRMAEIISGIVEDVVGTAPTPTAMSTDCNIPFSLGIPAAMIGVCSGGGAHTREEWIGKGDFHLGLEVGIKIALAMTEVTK
ncbi:MAG: M20/M25/M40 family metallo-hydrolase [Clostridia bacterium]|nr:M20/M25/M40 family metallo-hydrolase [Clostridia bacterium]